MFPVFLKTSEESDATERAPIAYEIAANGVFEVRHTPMYRSTVRVAGAIPGLVEDSEHVEVLAPRLPAALMEDVVAFFGHVYRLCDGEAIVVLFFNPQTCEYRFSVPRQTLRSFRGTAGRWVTSLSVRYENVARPEGFLRCGTIHSHADLPANASHTDCADEEFEDGFHLVVGDLDRDTPSLSAAMTVAGARFKLRIADIVEPFDPASARRPSEDAWLARVSVELSASGERTLTDAARLRRLATRQDAAEREARDG
jgi:hypothetical protein